MSRVVDSWCELIGEEFVTYLEEFDSQDPGVVEVFEDLSGVALGPLLESGIEVGGGCPRVPEYAPLMVVLGEGVDDDVAISSARGYDRELPIEVDEALEEQWHPTERGPRPLEVGLLPDYVRAPAIGAETSWTAE